MACETKTEIVAGAEYTCTQYPAIQGMTFKMELIKLIGPALQEVLPSILRKDVSDGEQAEALVSAIEKIFFSASPEKIVGLLVDMMTTGNLKREGVRVTRSLFEQIYSGDNMIDAYKAFAFVIRTNYSNLINSQKVADLLATTKEASE